MEKNRVFAPQINPLFVACHLNNPKELSQETLNYFKQHEPIGCRDFSTRDFLQKHGIAAYFTGCLTTTLGNTYKVSDSERTDEIIFTDFNSYSIRHYQNVVIGHIVRKLLKKSYNLSKAQKMTHILPFSPNLGITERLEIAENNLKRYAKARLVITKRIHCALPCLALGTPVILIVRKYDPLRFPGLADWCNTIGFDRNKKLMVNVQFDENRMVKNPELFKPYAQRLTEICKTFYKIK